MHTKPSLSLSIIFSLAVLLLPVAADASITYSRFPAGTLVPSPVTINVSASNFSDYGLPLQSRVYRIVFDTDDEFTPTGKCYPVSALSISETFIFQAGMKIQGVIIDAAVGSGNPNDCSSLTTGVKYLEGDGTGIVFSVYSGTPGTPSVTLLPAVTSQSQFVFFLSDLSFGSAGDDVKRLQEFLARDRAIYPEGFVTGFFGSFTQKAVERFQIVHGIVSSGDPVSTGFGRVGPRTRAKLNEVFGGSVSASPPSATNPEREAVLRSLQNQIQTLQEKVDLLRSLQR